MYNVDLKINKWMEREKNRKWRKKSMALMFKLRVRKYYLEKWIGGRSCILVALNPVEKYVFMFIFHKASSWNCMNWMLNVEWDALCSAACIKSLPIKWREKIFNFLLSIRFRKCAIAFTLESLTGSRLLLIFKNVYLFACWSEYSNYSCELWIMERMKKKER